MSLREKWNLLHREGVKVSGVINLERSSSLAFGVE